MAGLSRSCYLLPGAQGIIVHVAWCVRLPPSSISFLHFLCRLRSRLEHLVALLLSLQPLNTPLVHLLLHLGKPFAFFLGCALCLDSLDSSLLHCQLQALRTRRPASPTTRSASFSSLSSFSFAFTAASAFLSARRFSHVDWFAFGRNGALLSCHCLPACVVR